MPLRLTFVLSVIVILAVIVVGNPGIVDLQLLFWQQEIELYKIILISALAGSISTLAILSHIHSFKRLRGSRPLEKG